MTPSPAMAIAPALLTGERLVVFLFAARVALTAPAHLAAPLVVLAGAALAVELAVDGSAPASSPLRRFNTRCALTLLVLHVLSRVTVELDCEYTQFGPL
jgi:hypothetical protein